MEKTPFRKHDTRRPKLARAISAAISEYTHGEGIEWHQHQFGQLAFSTSGVVRVLTPMRTWIIPPTRAVWLPPYVEHSIVAVGEARVAGIYIDPDRLPWPWKAPTQIAISALVRELATTLAEGEHTYERDSAAGLSAALLLKVLPGMPEIDQGSLPMPRDERLSRICEHLLDNPACEDSLDVWGARLGASSRTLARHFKEETGITFRTWRQQVRVAEAITRLAQGHSVTRVSADLRYGSASAFIAMFKHITGEPPQRYLASR